MYYWRSFYKTSGSVNDLVQLGSRVRVFIIVIRELGADLIIVGKASLGFFSFSIMVIIFLFAKIDVIIQIFLRSGNDAQFEIAFTRNSFNSFSFVQEWTWTRQALLFPGIRNRARFCGVVIRKIWVGLVIEIIELKQY